MNFDRLAPHYDWMEAVCGGGLLQQARTVWLGELSGRSRILSAGEGHGRFAAACAARFPKAELTCVEASGRMLDRARSRAGAKAAHLIWRQSDVLAWTPDGRYDAIATCFFLDCFTPEVLAKVIAKLARCATGDAVWLVVDFNIPSRGFAHWRARAVHALMYTFFRQVVALPANKLTPPDELLRTHGFALAGRREFSGGLLRADLWQRG